METNSTHTHVLRRLHACAAAIPNTLSTFVTLFLLAKWNNNDGDEWLLRSFPQKKAAAAYFFARAIDNTTTMCLDAAAPHFE